MTTGNILAVDDDHDTLRVLIQTLARQGYTVRAAPEAQLALTATRADLPDLILLDIVMPDMSGYELCTLLKEDPHTREVPVIFISGVDAVIDKVRAFEAGGVDYITKPFHQAELVARVATHLALRKLQLDLQAQNARLQHEIAARTHAEQALVAEERALAAQEERAKLSRELHDSIGQILSFISTQAQAAQDLLAENQALAAHTNLTRLIEVAHQTSADLRQYILGLRPTDAAESGFFTTLTAYLEHFTQYYGIPVALSIPPEHPPTPFNPAVEDQVLRILQEALMNVYKHAEARAVQVLVTLEADYAQIIIIDDGTGFEVPAPESAFPAQDAPHFGLRIMRERAAQISGTLEIRSTPESGTQILLRAPRAAEDVPSRALRLLLVDDNELFVEGLRSMLTAQGFAVVGVATDGIEAQEQARALRPDLIVMDVQMPKCDGLTALQKIKAEWPEARVVMLTVVEDEACLLTALKAGAVGYLLKDFSNAEFCAALHELARGEVTLTPELATRVVTEFAHYADSRVSGPPALTPRQWEALQLVAQGLIYKEVAQRLNISEATVKYLMGQVLSRLQVENRAAAVAYATQYLEGR